MVLEDKIAGNGKPMAQERLASMVICLPSSYAAQGNPRWTILSYNACKAFVRVDLYCLTPIPDVTVSLHQ
jgi:hypothetical protein